MRIESPRRGTGSPSIENTASWMVVWLHNFTRGQTGHKDICWHAHLWLCLWGNPQNGCVQAGYPETTNAHTHRHTDTQTHRHTNTETQRHRDTETQTHRDTETQRHKDTETQRHRDTETQRHRDTETQRHKDTKTQR